MLQEIQISGYVQQGAVKDLDSESELTHSAER